MSQQLMPSAASPVVERKGNATSPWRNFFQALSALLRVDAVAVQSVGASPFTYTASGRGHLLISGGTVSAVSLTRSGTAVAMPASGLIPMADEDRASVTFSVAPTITWIPL